MRVSDYDFDLPEKLIAQAPLAERCASRMLVIDPEQRQVIDAKFMDLVDLLYPGDLLVLNDTRVLNARFFGAKASGGKVECLLERTLDEQDALVQIRASKSLRPGTEIRLPGGMARVLEREGSFYRLHFELDSTLQEFLQDHGHTPLPPYIRRDDEAMDQTRYQTVYARHDGAVAAPTAGLHFDQGMLRRLQDKGVAIGFTTLHVGAGTFQPVRVDRVEAHRMHAERVRVSALLCRQVKAVRSGGGRVIAGGTTVVRALESASVGGALAKFSGDTSLFLYPGKKFRVVDALLSNFHLPRSTLLMLVSAFAGRELILEAYGHAVAAGYRFFSYGDAMFITGPAVGVRDGI